MRPFFHKVYITFNTLSSTLSKTLYISVVKFPASASENVTEALFYFPLIYKMASKYFIPYRAEQMVVGRCQIWAVSRTRKNSPSHF
jgi:hypothetical protein